MKKTKKNKGGRPLLFDSKTKLQSAIDKYFEECKNNKAIFIDKMGKSHRVSDPIIPTIAGCAYEIEMDRQTFYNYAKKDKFFDTIKKARNYIIAQWESKLINTNANAGGIIFTAKNYGYADKQEIQHSGGVTIIRDDIR